MFLNALFLITTCFLIVCTAQEKCEIFPRNPIIPYGFNLTLFLKAPSSSDCHSKMQFHLSKIFWTLNKRKIDERFYDFNSTVASVSIHNLSVDRGTVECFIDAATPVLLHGVFVQTYPLVSSPQNVSCIATMNFSATVTCMWDHDQHSTDIKYTVYLKQKKEHWCNSLEKNCTFPENFTLNLDHQLSIRVVAQNSDKYSAFSNNVIYRSGWDIFQMDQPGDVIAEALSTGLRVTWEIEEIFHIRNDLTECEIQLHEKDSYTEALVTSVKNCEINTLEVTEVKPCTNYSVSMRKRFHGAVWSKWSHEVTALSYLNVSSLPLYLWRSKSVLDDEGKRTVHVMWKGVPPSCKAFDEYCIFYDFLRLKCFGPYQNHTFIALDKHPHRITLAVFRNDIRLSDTSIEVPALAEEINLPPVSNISVFVQHGCISITWEKPRLPVSGYLIVWNSTAKNHMWQQTQKTSFTLKDEPFTLYTISLIPLYEDGPGNEITLHNCSPERKLTAVSNVQVTGFSDKHAEIRWLPLLPSQCCAFVLNYTVFYQTYNETKSRNVTVGPSQHYVILEDLQPRTTYSIYIMANTVAASSKSVPIIFSTKNSKYYLIVITICCVALILLSTLAVMIQRKVLSKKIPDPRFSSLSMWPSDKCRNPWSLLPVPGGGDTEKILPCHVDGEFISVSSKTVTAALKTLADIQNIATHTETPSQSQITQESGSFSNRQLTRSGKEQRVLPSLDFQTSGVSHQEFPPPIQSPYRKQTPLSSPLESPNKPPWSDETETLLTPKLKNTNYFTSYVTMDMMEPGKHQPSEVFF
ncbi:interleukin-6 receptor subunit beta-like [Tachysurus fulvidraco]|uniref:interleukin-6 receptor subunit beta-like n=1 Tax=Tachysurus fulvidraco TaxID=1234273 RepID=UPI001FEFCB3C|nr:interleukin-6 receptor subunit beta-like [Tachysurus fulvidraco]XP_026996795.2 interleukin-6 receptor subunit beta-like [Tachysurus fulvidraco]XP_047661253.1 interleukin-6 receptor subunit beta-like [Tachysurus fulvidraco]